MSISKGEILKCCRRGIFGYFAVAGTRMKRVPFILRWFLGAAGLLYTYRKTQFYPLFDKGIIALIGKNWEGARHGTDLRSAYSF